MHSLAHFLHRHHSRESTPPREKESNTDSAQSTSSNDSRGSLPNDSQPASRRNSCSRRSRRTSESDSRNSLQSDSQPISIISRRSSMSYRTRGSSESDTRSYAPSESLPIPSASRRSSCSHRLRGTSDSSPREYPSFQTYFRDVMETGGSPVYHTIHPDHRSRKTDWERYQTGVNAYQVPRHDHRNFVSPLYGDDLDDIQENEYSKCDRYGEITNTKLSHTPYKNRFDNKSFIQKLTETVTNAAHSNPSNERRGSGSSGGGHRHKHNTIQELIRTFSKKVGHWRHDSGEGRRGSCAVPSTSTERAVDSDEFRSRSKSLDCDHAHKVKSILDDCGATYQIYESILKEGNCLVFFW